MQSKTCNEDLPSYSNIQQILQHNKLLSQENAKLKSLKTSYQIKTGSNVVDLALKVKELEEEIHTLRKEVGFWRARATR